MAWSRGCLLQGSSEYCSLTVQYRRPRETRYKGDDGRNLCKPGWSLVIAKALVVSRNGGRTDRGQECEACGRDMPLFLKDLVDLKSKRCSASELLFAESASCLQQRERTMICLCGATHTPGAQLAPPPWSSRQTLSTHPQASASRRCSHRDQAGSPAFFESY